MTFKDFKEKAMALETEYLKDLEGVEGSDRILQIQRDYWDIVEKHTSKRLSEVANFDDFIKEGDHNTRIFKVEYAADLPTNKFGSGFPNLKQDKLHGAHPWNFLNLNDAKDSLLSFWKGKDISGINIPWLYIGMLYSSFCWHYEDLMMYSINYMHEGAGKMWYSIPSHCRSKFESVAKRKFRKLVKEDPNFLFNINSMIWPGYLAKNGVTVYSTLQKPGEFILTFPESYHAGFSVGFNVAEAVNFTSPTWISYAEKAMQIYLTSREKVPVFPLQWLLLETDQKLPEYVEKVVNEELAFRDFIKRQYKQKLKSAKAYQKKLETIEKDDEVKYECYYCINLCYASFLKCNNCDKHYWISHGFVWGCSPEKINLYLRYTDEELLQKLADSKLPNTKH